MEARVNRTREMPLHFRKFNFFKNPYWKVKAFVQFATIHGNSDRKTHENNLNKALVFKKI